MLYKRLFPYCMRIVCVILRCVEMAIPMIILIIPFQFFFIIFHNSLRIGANIMDIPVALTENLLFFVLVWVMA